MNQSVSVSVSVSTPSPARDRLARRGAPFVWQESARRMAERLPLLRLQPELVVDAGCAWGDGLALLRRQYPQARLLGVEPSPALAARARREHGAAGWMERLRGRRQVEVLEGPLHGGAAPADAQMVWSNLALPWGDPAELFAGWQRLLRPDGVLMFTTFGPDTLRELRALGESVPAFVDMHDLGDLLVQHGFADPVMDMEFVRLRYADAAAALAELAELGRPPHAGATAGLRTPRRWRALQQALQEQARAAGRSEVELTFELVYGHAFKPATARAEAGVASFPLEQLRASARMR